MKLAEPGDTIRTTIYVYQIRDNIPDRHYIAYESLESLEKFGYEFKPENYHKVSEERFVDEDIKPESLFIRYNAPNKPNGYKGHSLSVSDVIVIDKGEDNIKAFYCDSYEFVEVPQFVEWINELDRIDKAAMAAIDEHERVHAADGYLAFPGNRPNTKGNKMKEVNLTISEKLINQAFCEELVEVAYTRIDELLATEHPIQNIDLISEYLQFSEQFHMFNLSKHKEEIEEAFIKDAEYTAKWLNKQNKPLTEYEKTILSKVDSFPPKSIEKKKDRDER